MLYGFDMTILMLCLNGHFQRPFFNGSRMVGWTKPTFSRLVPWAFSSQPSGDPPSYDSTGGFRSVESGAKNYLYCRIPPSYSCRIQHSRFQLYCSWLYALKPRIGDVLGLSRRFFWQYQSVFKIQRFVARVGGHRHRRFLFERFPSSGSIVLVLQKKIKLL